MPICNNCNQPFTIYPEDQKFYAKIGVPEPTKCPTCRNQLRLSFRNEHYYYPAQCSLCQKSIISVYNPKRVKKIYCHKCWWSDNWDPRQFAREFDFNRPFFEQYNDLLQDVPKLAMMNDNNTKSTNCEYTYDFAYGKDCYLVIASWYVENVYYSFLVTKLKDGVDCYSISNCEMIHECVICQNCYGCRQCQECIGCRDIIFGYDLRGCSDCLFCFGLRNQQFCIFNKQYLEEEYQKMKKEFDFGSYVKSVEYKRKFKEFSAAAIHRYADLVKCENCVGDHLSGSKNAFWCFHKDDVENGRYLYYGTRSKDTMDCTFTGENELCFEGVTPDTSYNTLFTIYCWRCRFVEYSENCHASEDLFGCVGMKKSKQCILNKQYDDSSFKQMKEKIVEYMKKTGEYGQFFSPRFTPFGYNESAAFESFPLSQKEAEKSGYTWVDGLPYSSGRETIKPADLPDQIVQVPDNITNEVLACVSCQKNYKILPQELNFYKKNNIPLPRSCFHCRHLVRRAMVNPDYLWHRQCMRPGCTNEFETTYSPDRPEKVYCEECYRKEIY